jgi:hypothetical protein
MVFGGVDTGMAGVYCASASPDLGTDYALEGGVSLPRQLYAVSIQFPVSRILTAA